MPQPDHDYLINYLLRVFVETRKQAGNHLYPVQQSYTPPPQAANGG